MVKAGGFRQDLYFRLNVVNLHIPALSARKEDVPLLAHHFLLKHAALMGKDVGELAPDTLELLRAYDFPGNVRELENIIERGVALSSGHRSEPAQLPEDLRELSIRTFRKKEGRIPSLDSRSRTTSTVLREAAATDPVRAKTSASNAFLVAQAEPVLGGERVMRAEPVGCRIRAIPQPQHDGWQRPIVSVLGHSGLSNGQPGAAGSFPRPLPVAFPFRSGLRYSLFTGAILWRHLRPPG